MQAIADGVDQVLHDDVCQQLHALSATFAKAHVVAVHIAAAMIRGLQD